MKIISHLISFIIMIIIVSFTLIISINSNLKKNSILKTLDNINYYEYAYLNINNKVEDFIINKELRDSYTNYITKELIMSDIYQILDKKQVSHEQEFYNIIKKYSDDATIDKKYTEGIDNIYMKNLFPTNLFNKISFNSDILFSIVSFITIMVVLNLVLIIINNNLYYQDISFISSGIILLIPFTIIKIYPLNILYTNTYFTELLLSILNNILFNLFTVGLIIITIVIIKNRIGGVINEKN